MRSPLARLRGWWAAPPRDLVTRLREDMWGDGVEAADEIERLRKLCAEQELSLRMTGDHLRCLLRDIERQDRR